MRPYVARSWRRFQEDGVTAVVQSWAGPVRAGLHRATGGDGQDACSGDMLMEALLACAGVTLRSVATALGIEIRAAALKAAGFFDARGTLGVDRSAEVGVTDMVVTFELDTDADEATPEQARHVGRAVLRRGAEPETSANDRRTTNYSAVRLPAGTTH